MQNIEHWHFSTIISLVFMNFDLLLPKINAKIKKIYTFQHKSIQKLNFQKSSRLTWQKWVFQNQTSDFFDNFRGQFLEKFKKLGLFWKIQNVSFLKLGSTCFYLQILAVFKLFIVLKSREEIAIMELELISHHFHTRT